MATHEHINTNIDPNSALQTVKAFLPGLIDDLNKSLNDLRKTENEFTLAAVKQAFCAATCILIDGVADMGMSAATVIGSQTAMLKSSTSNEKIKNQIKPLDAADKRLEAIPNKTPAERAEQLDTKAQIHSLGTEQSGVAATLNNETMQWQAIGHGIGALPKSLANSAKTQLEAVQQVLSQLNQLAQGTYQQVLNTARGVLAVETIACLVALAVTIR
jgi:hypothetical protein